MKKVLLVLTMFSIASICAAGSDGASLFSKCKSCHGDDGSKKALGVSPALKGQSAAQISDKLKGYQTGSYGGAKKAMMQSQANKLSGDDIKALSDYISKF